MPEDRSRHGREMLVPLDVRTYRIAIVNGIIAMAAIRMSDEATILPLLVHRLSGMAWVVGVTLGACTLARAVTQVLIARRMDTLQYKLPDYVASSWARGLFGLAMAASLWWADRLPAALVIAAVAVATAARAAGGAWSMLGFTDVLAKAIPTTKRGSLWMWRRFLGMGIALVLVTPFVGYMIGPDSPYVFPRNYAVLFLISTAAFATGWILFAQVKEPPSRPSSRTLGMAMHLTRGWRLVRRDRRYRRLIRTQLLLGLAAGIRPFFVVFGAKVWGLSDEVAATFLALQIGAEIASSVIAGRISDRSGNRRVLIGVAITMACSSLLALAAALGDWNWMAQVAGRPLSMRMAVLGAAFVFGGLFMTGHVVGTLNYLMDIAPQRLRPSYQAFATGFTVPLALAPAVYGWAADALGFTVVFATGLVLSLAGLFVATKLPEPRDELPGEELERLQRAPAADAGAPEDGREPSAN